MRWRNLLFGTLAFWPMLLMLVGLVWFVLAEADPGKAFVVVWIGGTVIFGLTWLYFLWDVFHNPRLPKDRRSLWAAVLFFAGPYYFWSYIRDIPNASVHREYV